MKFTVRDKTMFQTVFSPSREEARTLLESVRYLWEEEVGARIEEILDTSAPLVFPVVPTGHADHIGYSFAMARGTT